MGRRSIKEITANMTEKELKKFEMERQHKKKVRKTEFLRKKYGITTKPYEIPEGLTPEEEKRYIHKKELKKYHYTLNRCEHIKERVENGDEPGLYSIYITLNKVGLRCEAWSRYRTDAIEKYEKLLEENRKNVSFPKTFTKTRYQDEYGEHNLRFDDNEFEILLLKRVEHSDQKITKHRNKDGEYVENEVIDKRYAIIRKDDWFVEESFHVCGHNPTSDRKSFRYIMDTYFGEKANRETSRNVFKYNSLIIVQYSEDLTYFHCKSSEQADLLYDKIMKEVGKDRYIIFSGNLNKRLVPEMKNIVMEKTGITQTSCNRLFIGGKSSNLHR